MSTSTETSMTSDTKQLDRRRFMTYFTGLGLTSTLMPGVLWAKLQEEKTVEITKEMLLEAEHLAGLEFTDSERDLMLEGLKSYLEKYDKLRKVTMDNSVVPALQFNPVLPGVTFDKQQHPIRMSPGRERKVPSNLEELADWPVIDIAPLVKSRQISPVELTNMYLYRLKRYDSKLHCVITLTEDLALEQARRADREIAAGRYRGPLHGIPWGAKDLLAVKGYKTTWGAMPYKDQTIDYDATVVRRLEEAGAVLIAKLTLGALAWGDVWFGGKTRNPWNPEKGSSGSSAGSASATAAGLVGFSIGTETHGSIVSPSTVCGATGLRPTFGRVSRYGAMALSWSMDKIGSICRCVEDCAVVLDAIYGPDGKDPTVAELPFNWDASRDVKSLRVGYLKSDFEQERKDKRWQANDTASLDELRRLGIDLVPIELPDYPIEAMGFILNVEAAAAFDEITRDNRDDLMVRQIKNAWPNRFREARMIPAVEYVQANRLRKLVMNAMQQRLSDIDVYVSPSWEGRNLLLTNLTGHPAVVVPNGLTEENTPSSITFTGALFGEDNALAVAKTYQDATSFHLQHPTL